MKKIICSFLALVMVMSLSSTMALAFAEGNYGSTSSEITINGIVIPARTKLEIVDGMTIYLDFVDSCTQKFYSFYNATTKEYFAFTSPVQSTYSPQESASRYLIHHYEFSIKYKTYNPPKFPINGHMAHIDGEARIIRETIRRTDVTNLYSSYRYQMNLNRTTLSGTGGGSWTFTAGTNVNGYTSGLCKGKFVLDVTAIDRLDDNDYLEGSGDVFYYDL